MKKQFLDAGQIVSAHGVQGDVRILPWCDGPEFLKQFSTMYVGGTAYAVERSRIHKTLLLCKFQGVDDMNAALQLKDKVVSINRDDASLPEGRVFIADLLGLPVFSGGRKLGVLKDVYSGPANDVYLVAGETEYQIPAVPEFLEDVNPDEGYIRVRLIPGMAADEN